MKLSRFQRQQQREELAFMILFAVPVLLFLAINLLAVVIK